MEERVKAILRMGETVDIDPPWSCLPRGCEEWLNLKARGVCQLIEQARLTGIKEVVEWVRGNTGSLPTFSVIEGMGNYPSIKIPESPGIYLLNSKWQAKLKEWGL